MDCFCGGFFVADEIVDLRDDCAVKEKENSAFETTESAVKVVRLKLTQLLPLLGPKNQLVKLFSHFSAVVEQGDGHLIHYKKLEQAGIRVLQFLKAPERVRNTLLHDDKASEGQASFTIFHAAVAFLKSFCDFEPHYRDLFMKKEVFEFLVSCISDAEEVRLLLL